MLPMRLPAASRVLRSARVRGDVRLARRVAGLAGALAVAAAAACSGGEGGGVKVTPATSTAAPAPATSTAAVQETVAPLPTPKTTPGPNPGRDPFRNLDDFLKEYDYPRDANFARIKIPAISVDARVASRTVWRDGVMPDPSGPADVVWYDLGEIGRASCRERV